MFKKSIPLIKFTTFIIALFVSSLILDNTSIAAADNIQGNKPTEVKVALQVDQVTDVDQKAENFTIVGSLIMQWNDSRMAFDPDTM
jgi:hypothetical protein